MWSQDIQLGNKPPCHGRAGNHRSDWRASLQLLQSLSLLINYLGSRRCTENVGNRLILNNRLEGGLIMAVMT
jgi:hypothetical protein